MYLTQSKKKKIEKKCEQLWLKYDLKPSFNIVTDLIAPLGIENDERELNGVSGLIVFDESKEKKALISINKNDIPPRKRFSYAHELGHFFLHSQKEFKVDKREMRRDSDSSKGEILEEVEANYFAASLLMPEKEILKSINLDIGFEDNVEIIRNHFDVSASAASIRLQSLGFQII